MKIIVLGAGGMAGHVIALHLRENGHTVDTLTAHNKLDAKTMLIDVTDQTSLVHILDEGSYDVIVNCVGLLVKQSEEQKDKATYINAYLPHFLETHLKNSKTKLIHLSTDCVFSGRNPPYREDSSYDGELFYDRSKALGEVINNKDLTFRMSIIGPDMQENGSGLFNWFYKQTGEITGYTKAIWSGITTIELAKGVAASIEQNLTGLYHLVPNTNISKYELLQLLVTTFKKQDVSVVAGDGVALDKTLVNTRKDFDFVVPDYITMTAEMKAWIYEHSSIYPQYAQ